MCAIHVKEQDIKHSPVSLDLPPSSFPEGLLIFTDLVCPSLNCLLVTQCVSHLVLYLGSICVVVDSNWLIYIDNDYFTMCAYHISYLL